MGMKPDFHKSDDRVDHFWIPFFDELAKKLGVSRGDAAEAFFDELPNAWRRMKQEAMGLPEEVYGVLPLDPNELLGEQGNGTC